VPVAVGRGNLNWRGSILIDRDAAAVRLRDVTDRYRFQVPTATVALALCPLVRRVRTVRLIQEKPLGGAVDAAGDA
jgi:hypothetical protein